MSDSMIREPFFNRLNKGIDNVIEVFSPRAAFLRRYARESSRMLSKYSGASTDRLRATWLPGGGSADSDLLPDLSTLRERSRDLMRNNGYAIGISKTYTANIVASGIRPQSRLRAEILGISDEQAKDFQKQFENYFNEWTEHADAGDRLDFYEIQNLILKQIIDNGDVVSLPVRRKKPGVGEVLSYQLVEGDRLTTPPGKITDKTIREGVEIGKYGEPRAYWIKATHPGDSFFGKYETNDYIRYPSYDQFGNKRVLHLYFMDRVGQSRGMPILSPVLNLFKDLSSYMEAELLKNRIAACFALFVKRTDPLGNSGGRSTSTINGKRQEHIEPGQIIYGQVGESMEVAVPNNTSGTVEPFVVIILRMIAAAVNVPYEVVAKDFSKTNYSSARAALLDAIKFFRSIQTWLNKKHNQPVYNSVIEDGYLQGKLIIPNFYEFKNEWCRVKWQAPGWQWIEPYKEVQAAEKAIQNKIKSRADICGQLGEDWEETFEQISAEEKRAKELGIDISVKSNDKNNTSGNDGDPENNSDQNEE